ncbi:MAG: hypothetical protein VW870_12325, partial [Rhodobiaceae bacterium]
NRAYVHMRLGTIKLLLGHASPSSSSVCRTVLRGTVPDLLILDSRSRLPPEPGWRQAALSIRQWW